MFWGRRFLILPVVIGVSSGIGSGVRWYRTLFLEEVGKDYVRTARAKGLTETQTPLKHVLPNAMIPVLTGVVVVLPLLFMGSLIMESFFSIPGLGVTRSMRSTARISRWCGRWSFLARSCMCLGYY